MNPLYKKINKIGEAYEMALYLREERKMDVEKLKEKVLQVEQ